MKEGIIEKGYTPEKDDYEKIMQFTRKPFSEEELYVFRVMLCNNDIDRDNEKFSVSALNELASLFIGKTGIKDHSMKSEDQTARIFDTAVEQISGRKTADGEPFYALFAKAYMVISPETQALIRDIDAGIKKEVSVSCSMAECICSICGENKRKTRCTHIPGRDYEGRRCFNILSGAQDAYEFSFVAVPAQREAGVEKSFSTDEGSIDMQDIIKSLSTAQEITLSAKSANELGEYIKSLEEQAELGREYKESLARQITKLCEKAIPYMDLKTFAGVASVMTTDELLKFKAAFEKQNAQAEKPAPQLAKAERSKGKGLNEFKI